MGEAFYNWFTENAMCVYAIEDAQAVGADITYNGKTIATLAAGQTAILHCKGEGVDMLSDIVVTTGSGNK